MLKCQQVQAALPGIVAGESDTEALREHVAACDDCRAERDRLTAELATLREELTALTPSPFLENAVLDTARESEPEEHIGSLSRRRISRRTWIQIGVAVAAAVLLFVLRPGFDGDDPTSSPESTPERHAAGDGSMRVWVPPSPQQVAEARAENVIDLSVIDSSTQLAGMLHKSHTGHKQISKTFLPIDEKLRHRWVYGDGDGLPARMKHTLESHPRPGVMLVGNGLLRELGDALVRSGVGVMVDGKQWRSTPGSAEAELTLGSPDEYGAQAQVRVLVSTAYSGTILVEETMARALGLYQFEIPGGFEVAAGKGWIEGQRARARVQIPELGFDGIVEVQVRGHIRRDRNAPTPSLSEFHFTGELPQSVTVGAQMSFQENKLKISGQVRGVRLTDGAETQVQFPTKHGPLAVAMHFGPGRVKKEYVPLEGEKPRAPGPDGHVLAGTFDIGAPEALARELHVDRVTLEGKDEPGARVTMARVWRGTTAIPSREGVAITNVAEDGTITFPRLAGERGSKLRMLVTGKDGVSTFYDVIVNKQELADPRLVITVQRDGTVSFRGTQWQLPSHVTPKGYAASLGSILEALKKMTAVSGARDEQGLSRYTLQLVVEPSTPWQIVQYLMQIAAHPDVKIYRIRFGDSGYELPRDRGLASTQPERRKIKVVVLLQRDEHGARVRIRMVGGATIETPAVKGGPAVLDEKYAGYVAAAIQVLKRKFAGSEIVGEIAAPTPSGGKVPYAVIQRIYQAFLDEGITRVRFEGAAPPR